MSLTEVPPPGPDFPNESFPFGSPEPPFLLLRSRSGSVGDVLQSLSRFVGSFSVISHSHCQAMDPIHREHVWTPPRASLHILIITVSLISIVDMCSHILDARSYSDLWTRHKRRRRTRVSRKSIHKPSLSRELPFSTSLSTDVMLSFSSSLVSSFPTSHLILHIRSIRRDTLPQHLRLRPLLLLPH